MKPLPGPNWREDVRTKWAVGVDLGQAQDFTAISVIEHRAVRHIRHDGFVSPAGEVADVRFLRRLPLGLSYPQQIGEVQQLLARPPLCDGAELVVDETGCGRPVCDLLNDVGLKPTRISITAGDTFNASRGGWHVAKSLLVSTLDAALHDGGIRIAAALTEAGPLAEELKDFRRKVSAAGRYSFSARDGATDDLILSISIALWVLTRRPKSRPAMAGRYTSTRPEKAA